MYIIKISVMPALANEFIEGIKYLNIAMLHHRDGHTSPTWEAANIISILVKVHSDKIHMYDEVDLK